MTKRKKAQWLRWFKLMYSTVVPTSQKGWTAQLIDLSAQLESLASTDAYKTQVGNIYLDCICYCDTPFYHQFAVVQTNYAWSGTMANLSQETVQTLLDQPIIGKDFSVEMIGQVKVARPIPHNNSSETMMHGVHYRIQIARKIIDLLNKEASTEHLQQIHLGCCGVGSTLNDTITMYHGIEIEYKLTLRDLAIR